MRSDTFDVRQIFQERRQYVVPFYQRAYVWTLGNQWENLWLDIQAKADARLAGQTLTPHFLGAIVVERQRAGLRGVDTYPVIDGQQRLTTLQYILTALQIAFREEGFTEYEASIDECRLNPNPATMNDPEIERHKVWPTFRDRANHTTAVAARRLDDLKASFPTHFTQAGKLRSISIEHPPALAAIWYFVECIRDWLAKAGVEKPRAAEVLTESVMTDLKIVLILLDPEDDPQVIFETLNGRGASLHATDLIRNFIFLRAERERSNTQQLYETRWKPFEDKRWGVEERRGRLKKPRLEWLVHTALQSELGREVDLPRLYAEYKAYATATDPPRTAQNQLATLSEYAEHFDALTQHAGSLPIARFGKRLAPYESTTAHSLALLISTSSVDDAQKTVMFNDLVSYVVRRAVCDITTKNLNNTFMSAVRHLSRDGVSPATLRAFLAGPVGTLTRWPRDDEFRTALLRAPLYYGRLDAPKMRALLTELEGELRKTRRTEEPVVPDLTALDIDHILPRSWMEYWPLSDGTFATPAQVAAAHLAEVNGLVLTETQAEIRRREAAKSTLGNLSLLNLSVNRAAQNHAFLEKRRLFIRNTNLSLNVPLMTREIWDEVGIAERGEQLSAAAMALYPGPG